MNKQKARQFDIPEENCFVGDAQRMPFQGDEKFDKILFPLSLASFPNPQLALNEAYRVLAPNGKIVVFEKLVDDGTNVSWGRSIVNVVAKCVIADVTRNLSNMMGEEMASPLKITHYESLKNRQTGMAGKLGAYYRVAVLTRREDYPEQPAIPARLRAMQDHDTYSWRHNHYATLSKYSCKIIRYSVEV